MLIVVQINTMNENGGADKKLDFLSDPIIPSKLHRT